MVGYAGRKILVTGGTGFIGSRLAERLAVEEAAKVRVLVHDWGKAVWISRVNVELVQGDIRDKSSVAKAIQGCEIVFQCAAAGGNQDVCITTNVEGTRNVLECAANACVERVVYLSSIAVHGPTPPDNADEKDEFRRSGQPYADSKVGAEEVVWQFWKQHRLPVVVIRPAPVWGPRGEWFTVWPVSCMKAGQRILVDGGRGTCDVVYIDNLVDALLLSGLKTKIEGEAFLITDGHPCTWAEFFGHYARMLGVARLPSIRSDAARIMLPAAAYIDRVLCRLGYTPTWEPARTLIRAGRLGLRLIRGLVAPCAITDPSDVARYAHRGKLDISKACTLLGYTPHFSLEEGMRETETWLRDQRIIPDAQC